MSGNISISGNLTRDPELRFTKAGKGVCSFGIAAERRVQENGEWVSKTSYFNVTCWDALGENAAASLTKGMRVVVYGRIEVREYQANDGTTRQSLDITADDLGVSVRWGTVTGFEKVRRSEGGAAAPARAAAPAAADPYGDDSEPF
jgi:single-strand DNA-binding protein